MALSFKDSIDSIENANTASTTSSEPENLSIQSDAILLSEEQYSSTNEEWTINDRYTWYDDFDDSNISNVDAKKNIILDNSQINLSQEELSQFIPFEMPRRYDNFDLATNTRIQFHYVNANKDEDYVSAVNVKYTETKLRFALLVPYGMTHVAGNVLFEIIATGTNSKGENYKWISRACKDLNVIESLSGNGIVNPTDSDWYTQFVRDMDAKILEAQSAVQQAENSVSDAQSAALQAQTAATQAQSTVDQAKTELQNSLNQAITIKLSDYYTKVEVDTLLNEIDLSAVYDAINNIDGLANFNTSYNSETRVLTFYNGDTVIKSETLNSNPTTEWVTAYDTKVDGKISTATSNIQTDLNQYKQTVNSDLEEIHSEIDGLPQTLESDYYKKNTIDELLDDKADKSTVNTLSTNLTTIESTTNTNKSNIVTLGTKIADLETTIGNIDTSPRLTYEATYDEEQIYTLWEIEGEGDNETRTAKGQFKISGGGGGTSTSSILKIEYITKTPITATVNDTVIIKYNFSGIDSSGDEVTEGTATWRVGNSVIATNIAVSGENSFDVTDYLSIGTQKIMLSITDDAGSLVTKTWTVQKIDVRLESTFNDKLLYPIGNVSFGYTPYGSIAKNVHFVLDGTELGVVNTSSSGIPMSYTIPSQSHGSHLLEAYITAVINNTTIETNHILKDIIFYDETSTLPIIGCTQQNITIKQYDSINISYVVYDPNTETPQVTLSVDGNIISTLVLNDNIQTWQYKSSDIGEHILTIACRDTVKTIIVTVEELGINIEPVIANLAFDFNPSGRSNNDEYRLWSDGEVTMTVSDNFDWVNGGYQIDENGDQYFGIKAGTSATIDYKLFADDAKRNGKEFKLIFKTTNVKKSDATFLSCLDGSTAQIGLQMNVHEAYVYASAGNLYLPYSEEDIIEFEININKDTDIPMVMGYEDGVATRPMIYSDSHDFTQINPQVITIGSDDCDVYIYRMKAYSSSLTDTGILNNFIADARNADEMIARYNRNQIYDENNLLTPESLAKACPDLKIIKLECPHFTNDKKDFVKNTNIECIHTGGDPVLDNWTAKNTYHSGQGTTSNEYGASGRNIDILMCFDGKYTNSKIAYDANYKTILTLGDGTIYDDGTGKITLTRTSVPTNYLNLKVNIASSENANNALLQKRYNTYLPYQSVAQQNDSRVKNSMEFVNCVIFVKESDPDLTTHREFNNTEWNYYALGNIGDSKKTDYTRVNDAADPKEFVVEIMDNTLPNSTFSGTDEALAALDADQFDEEGTYGWRYEMDGITDEQREENMQTWRNFYRFVVNSTDEEFVAQLGDWFVLDSALYFYLFTERYTMIDNRAKNTFFHYAKCEDGVYRFDLWDYDNDTAIGINNSGELTMTYGKEDTDYRTDGEPSSGYIFNAAESTFFCRIRDLMYDQLANMFVDCESQNCWSSTSLINQFDEWQSQFPEELWRLDIERKYLRTYRDGNTRFLTSMMNGRKKYQRRQFERDQEKYMATKYFGTTATSDQIMFRCNTPKDAVVTPDYTLHLTPYADMYLSVMFGATYRKKVRAKAGRQYDIECPFTTMDDTAVLIYCASQIQAIGDLSGCYIHDNDFSKASKLQELIIGNTTEGYQNTFLTNLGIGNNTLLQKLDIQNTPNLAQSLNLSSCSNLEELYAYGSGLTGVIFADGGKIRIAQLPAITSITMRDLTYFTGLNISDLKNMTTLIIENCNTVDILNIFDKAPNINRVRITGINWTLNSSDLLERIYNMYGIDKNGYNISQSVLSGHVHVPVVQEQKLKNYHNTWSDLDITYDTIITQFAVTFQNYDGAILDVQYVDKGGSAVDPVTRVDNPIATPTKPSSVSTDHTFSGWDLSFTGIFANRTITAQYSESTREYTVKYVARNYILQETKAPYGSSVAYTGEIPTYTDEESAYVYYLFKGWDKFGYVDGDKTINAVYDRFEYTDGCFDGMDISEMTPIQIYALVKSRKEQDIVEVKDSISFEMGTDYTYEDIEEHLIISEKTVFNGKNYIDTGIKLLETDTDWTLAIDYKWGSGNANNAVLMQCYQGDGSNGFKLWNSSQQKLSWGTASAYSAGVNNRDMLVLRHIKGDNKLYVYKGNIPADAVDYSELNATRSTAGLQTLVLGCSRADDGLYENYAIGTIYWCKLWHTDLGDSACRSLAAWTHESINLEMIGFRRYYLSDSSGSRCSMTFLASHLLDNSMAFNGSTSNSGGWAEASLNRFLNNRFYNALPIEWKQLVKQVKISSSIGDKSYEISTSNCYISVPSAIEIDASFNYEPYNYEGDTISYMISDESRLRKNIDGVANGYWLRSPNAQYSTYMLSVTDTGSIDGYSYALYEKGVCPMLSI